MVVDHSRIVIRMKNRWSNQEFTYSLITLLITSCVPKEKEQWIQLFNGQNLDGWVIKIKGSPWEKTTRTPSGWKTAL
jgi:hypothetical protein